MTKFLLAVLFLVSACGVDRENSSQQGLGSSPSRTTTFATAPALQTPLVPGSLVSLPKHGCGTCNGVPRCDVCASLLGNKVLVRLPPNFPPKGTIYIQNSKLQTLKVQAPSLNFDVLVPAGHSFENSKFQVWADKAL